MSDLTDALEIVERSVAYVDAQMREQGMTPADDATYIVLAAARRVAEAPEVWWCAKHNLPSTDMECEENGMGHRHCVPVRKLLVDPPKETA